MFELLLKNKIKSIKEKTPSKNLSESVFLNNLALLDDFRTYLLEHIS